jgi:hypothetical protein
MVPAEELDMRIAPVVVSAIEAAFSGGCDVSALRQRDGRFYIDLPRTRETVTLEATDSLASFTDVIGVPQGALPQPPPKQVWPRLIEDLTEYLGLIEDEFPGLDFRGSAIVSDWSVVVLRFRERTAVGCVRLIPMRDVTGVTFALRGLLVDSTDSTEGHAWGVINERNDDYAPASALLTLELSPAVECLERSRPWFGTVAPRPD